MRGAAAGWPDGPPDPRNQRLLCSTSMWCQLRPQTPLRAQTAAVTGMHRRARPVQHPTAPRQNLTNESVSAAYSLLLHLSQISQHDIHNMLAALSKGQYVIALHRCLPVTDQCRLLRHTALATPLTTGCRRARKAAQRGGLNPSGPATWPNVWTRDHCARCCKKLA